MTFHLLTRFSNTLLSKVVKIFGLLRIQYVQHHLALVRPDTFYKKFVDRLLMGGAIERLYRYPIDLKIGRFVFRGTCNAWMNALAHTVRMRAE
jgi:hypothetical protein